MIDLIENELWKDFLIGFVLYNYYGKFNKVVFCINGCLVYISK